MGLEGSIECLSADFYTTKYISANINLKVDLSKKKNFIDRHVLRHWFIS